MHLPGHILSVSVASCSNVFAMITLGAVCWLAGRASSCPSPRTFAAASGLLFALQQANFPVSAGISGHLLGGALAAYLLGVPFGILSLSFVVILQAVWLGDGSVSLLGANLLNLAVVPVAVAVAGAFRKFFSLKFKNSVSLCRYVWAGVAAFFAVMAAAVLCSLEIFASWQAPGQFLIDFLRVHLWTAFVEGAATMMILAWLTVPAPKFQPSERKLAFLTVLALCLLPLASSRPDGMNFVLHEYALWTVPTGFVPLLRPAGSVRSWGVLFDIVMGTVLVWGVARLTIRSLWIKEQTV